MEIKLSDEQMEILDRSIAEYRGSVTRLESAIGALVVGQTYGLRVLQVGHDRRVLKKHEEILGLKLKDVCPTETALTARSRGVQFAEKCGRFWDVATGRVAFKEKGVLMDSDN